MARTRAAATAASRGVASQHHQLQQRAPVSGTAKGKAKLKAGQPLKPSSIGAKKGMPSTGGGGGGRGRSEAMERITQISESCLNAPTPLRNLSTKERLLEAKRTGGDDFSRVLMGPPGLDYISLGLVDEEAIPNRVNASDANKEAIAVLPEKLHAAAMVPDMTPFPANQYMAALTPPIEGYIDKVRDAAKKHSVKEKLR
ncbi:hypothetical protein BAE44_0007825 [Dichanthelium oligosanthes]|uniref:Uncharacterized protein n=1 Tax=Dichanthelium oligosanthes TaxID=888268 RepID=A0A1E5W1D1_9POAL|nr:hypothetical protein BAE44_0007825 [Dichanthelium oligosanthes]